MATGSERAKVARHTALWMGSISLRLLRRKCSLQPVDGGIKKGKTSALSADASPLTSASYFWSWRQRKGVWIWRGSSWVFALVFFLGGVGVGGLFVCVAGSGNQTESMIRVGCALLHCGKRSDTGSSVEIQHRFCLLLVIIA